MDNNQIFEMIGRILAGEASTEDKKIVNIWLSDSSENQKIFNSLQEYWQLKSSESTKTSNEKALQRLLYRIENSDNQKMIDREEDENENTFTLLNPTFLKIAATVILILGITFFLYKINSSNNSATGPVVLLEQANPMGKTSKIKLPDGSTVWLNASSKIIYPSRFSLNIREIQLTGEAFFDVKKDASQPFIIQLKNSKIRVLGTSFNVKAFEEDTAIETSVVTGKVAFISENGSDRKKLHDTLILKPNTKAIFDKYSNQISEKETDTNDDVAWKDGRLIFKATPFDEVARQLERKYGLPIKFSNESLKNCRLTGTFRNEKLDEVMYVISRTNNYKYIKQTDCFVVSGQGCRTINE